MDVYYEQNLLPKIFNVVVLHCCIARYWTFSKCYRAIQALLLPDSWMIVKIMVWQSMEQTLPQPRLTIRNHQCITVSPKKVKTWRWSSSRNDSMFFCNFIVLLFYYVIALLLYNFNLLLYNFNLLFYNFNFLFCHFNLLIYCAELKWK